jgi:hypothetical protein
VGDATAALLHPRQQPLGGFQLETRRVAVGGRAAYCAAMRLWLVLARLLCSVSVSPAAAQAAKLYPSDEAPRDPGLFLARARLLQAIAERDTTVLLATVSPNIKNSFGGDGGIDEFRERWRLESPDSPLWSTLGRVLSLGGGFFSENTYIAPYVFSEFPTALDGFEHLAVVGRGVRAREDPDLESRVVATLDFDVIARDRSRPEAKDATGRTWVPVRLRGTTRGYVAAEYLRSPIDYRAGLVREVGQWRLAFFAAGD